MDHELVELRNYLRRYLQEEFPHTITDRYFASIDFRPKYNAGLMKATNLHFLTFDDARELQYVDDVFTDTEIVVKRPQFEAEPASSRWIDRIVNYSIQVDFPDLDPAHEDVIQWERFEQNGTWTGRLEIADETEIDPDVGPIQGIVKGMEFVAINVLPEHEHRSEKSRPHSNSSNTRLRMTGRR